MAWRRERVFEAVHVKGKSPKASRKVVRKKGAVASNGTVNRDLNLISGTLGRLVRLGHLRENPCSRVQKPKEPKGARVALSKEEAVRLVGACDDWFRPLVMAALFTGARRGELMALTWGDVSFETHTVTIHRSKVGNAGRIELHPALEAELRHMLAADHRIRPKDEPVFLNSYGRPVGDIRRPWRKAVEGAGLTDKPGICFHALRQYADFRTMPTSLAG